ncbi:MAG: DUF1501 domain-containing protein [Anaerolineales bacterium]
MTKLTRRDFLYLGGQLSLAAAIPTNLSNLLPRLTIFSPTSVDAPKDILVLIFQRGGMDGLNTVIPFTEGEYYNQRPSLAISEPKAGDDKTAIDLDGYFGFHPSLRPLKDFWDEGELAVVHACGSPDPTHSHFDAMDYMERGTPGEKSLSSGWLARHLQTAAGGNDSPFRAVSISGMLPGSLRGPVPALALKSIADFHLGGKMRSAEVLAGFQNSLGSLYQSANSSAGGPDLNSLASAAALTINTTETLEAAIQGEYIPTGGVFYPESEFGQAMKQIAQLIKADLGLEIATVDIGGWDTHISQGTLDGTFPTLLGDFAGGLAAFYTDLGELTKRVTIVSISEFGRRLQENGNAGTDHGHGNVMFILGGGVNGGKVFTDWPGLETDSLYGPGDLEITTDYRDVLAEIMKNRLMNNRIEEIFPGYEPKSLGVIKPT